MTPAEQAAMQTSALRGTTYIDPAKMRQQGLTAGGDYPSQVAPVAPPAAGYTPGTDAFAGGRTLRPGYESFGPMNDAEFQSLMRMRGRK
jgi:hypothetical protein